MGIINKPASKRSSINHYQLNLMRLLINELTREYQRRGARLSDSEFRALPEYQRFTLGAYATGFVCRDFAIHPQYEQIMRSPRVFIGDCTFQELRWFLHTLLRAEHWSDGYHCPIRQAIDNQALALVTARLASPETFSKPDIADVKP